MERSSPFFSLKEVVMIKLTTPAEAVLRQMSSLWREKRDYYQSMFFDTPNGEEWFACYFAANRVANFFIEAENELYGKLCAIHNKRT
jgi:hypothetical protein